MLQEIIGSLLHQCANTKNFRQGILLHAAAVKIGMKSDVIIGNDIVNFYAKCGCMNSAHQMFDEMSRKNLVTWSALISGYVQSKRPNLAIRVFSRMQEYFKPNEFVLSSVLGSCSVIQELKLGKQIHAQAVKLGYDAVSFVLNSLISMYMRCFMWSEALLIFYCGSVSGSLSLVSYNVAITGLVENEQGEKGFEIFKLMRQRGLVPDHFTFAGLLGPVERTYYNVSDCMQVHCVIVKLGFDYLAFTGNILIAMYSKFDFLEEAEKIFWLLKDKDVVSWNTLITACCRHEDNSRALSFFRDMVAENDARPDLFTYAGLLSAIAGLASMRHGKEIHSHLIRTRPDWDVGVGNALINMYAKSGSIGSAQAIFERMECRNLVSWNSIITAFANHGLAENVITLFMEMMRMRLTPDSVTFLGLLTACNHSGLAEEGQYLFDSMNKFYGITPNSEHLCCLVDVLGRAGRVSEAEEYIQKHQSGHDAVVLGSLLSACRLHGDVLRGEQTAARLLELDHITTSPYVLLSNLYASDRKWESVAGARKMLRGSGLKKEAAHSIVEVKGSFEKFVIGDFSHSRMDEILNLLRTLSWGVDEELLCC
ncbi:pentatricopeptide repeat-containing protein At4g32430, mitochondrial-like [Henckelia pumila]|uniref:pentatricopeptide repeat-containing protein At4g32430, mitochondrial-like n=1 Tax=Henckelia pumila TaxID=405737 RepID=UPI003C6E49BF